MDDKLTIFIAVTAAAVVLQMLILAAMFFVLRKFSSYARELSEDLYSRIGPLLTESKKLTTDLHSMLETSRPKVDAILDNASTVSAVARNQTEKLDAAVTSFVDAARLQVIRVDDLLTRTFNRVEDTSSRVQHTVLSPFKHLNGVLQGIGVGLETLFQKSRAPKDGRQSDEMFI